MFCSRCGTQIGDEDEFCPKCGNSLKTVSESVLNDENLKTLDNNASKEVTTILCPHCGGIMYKMMDSVNQVCYIEISRRDKSNANSGIDFGMCIIWRAFSCIYRDELPPAYSDIEKSREDSFTGGIHRRHFRGNSCHLSYRVEISASDSSAACT